MSARPSIPLAVAVPSHDTVTLFVGASVADDDDERGRHVDRSRSADAMVVVVVIIACRWCLILIGFLKTTG